MNITLNVTMPTDQEIVLTRSFHAPRRLVWDAMTQPELLMRWLAGPPGWVMTVCENDLSVGGVFRWEWRGSGGQQMVMRGVNHEIAAPERIVRSERFETGCDAKAGEQMGTLILTEDDGGGSGLDGDPECGQTSLALTLLYPSKAARDAAIASGMTAGMSIGYDRLADLLAMLLVRNAGRSAA